jgi:glycosyltransferase involved in cell wall biosynthesis
MDLPKDFELVVVDNTSTDETLSALYGFPRNVDFPVVLALKPTPILGNACNCGWKKTRIVIITKVCVYG